jgi:hypothetical protein
MIDAAECRRRALIFARYSGNFALAETRARFASIATNWMALAFKLEQQGATQDPLPRAAQATGRRF